MELVPGGVVRRGRDWLRGSGGGGASDGEFDEIMAWCGQLKLGAQEPQQLQSDPQLDPDPPDPASPAPHVMMGAGQVTLQQQPIDPQLDPPSSDQAPLSLQDQPLQGPLSPDLDLTSVDPAPLSLQDPRLQEPLSDLDLGRAEAEALAPEEAAESEAADNGLTVDLGQAAGCRAAVQLPQDGVAVYLGLPSDCRVAVLPPQDAACPGPAALYCTEGVPTAEPEVPAALRCSGKEPGLPAEPGVSVPAALHRPEPGLPADGSVSCDSQSLDQVGIGPPYPDRAHTI